MENLIPSFKEFNESVASKLATDIGKIVPEGTNINDFAKAIALVLKEEYGSHNYADFMGTLKANL